jgi:hypothetical protein
MAWQYQRTEQSFEQVPEGKHRVRIREVETGKSKNGNDMITIQLDVSGCDVVLYHFITFLNDRPEITNRMLTNFFDSFKDIPEGNFKFADWKGKVGACMVTKDKNDPNRTRLSYFIEANKQSDLPPWKEPATSPASSGIPAGFEEVKVNDSDLPW